MKLLIKMLWISLILTIPNTTRGEEPVQKKPFRYNLKKPIKPSIIKPIRILDTRPTTAPIVTDPGGSINSGESFRINWTSVPGATFYDYQLESDPSFTGAWTSGTNCTNSSFSKNVTAQTTYYFRVRARNNDGSGPWSNVVDMIVLPIPVLPAPTTPPVLSTSAATLLSDQTYTISWTAPQNATWYFLVESPDPSFSPSAPGSSGVNTGATSHSFHHEVNQTTIYYYRIRASNQSGETGWSNTVQVTINPRG